MKIISKILLLLVDLSQQSLVHLLHLIDFLLFIEKLLQLFFEVLLLMEIVQTLVVLLNGSQVLLELLCDAFPLRDLLLSLLQLKT